MAEEFGIQRVPGSGNQFHSKLDLTGKGARWSLKATDGIKFPIQHKDILEALHACFGLNGTGEIPLWGVRIDLGDFIIMRKEDFKELQKGELKIIDTETKENVADRRKRASIPTLLRDEKS